MTHELVRVLFAAAVTTFVVAPFWGWWPLFFAVVLAATFSVERR